MGGGLKLSPTQIRVKMLTQQLSFSISGVFIISQFFIPSKPGYLRDFQRFPNLRDFFRLGHSRALEQVIMKIKPFVLNFVE